ncbi:MAG: TetR/AcrR family transcriptional regulator [Comamonas sp.]
MTLSDTQAHADDHPLLAALAVAMVQRPRAPLQDLAKAAGVSKATLYRFCRTREQLVDRLLVHSSAMIDEAIRDAELDTAPPLEALRRLSANHLELRELMAFLVYYWRDDAVDPDTEAGWTAQMDGFFLRGQQAGVFRIDIAAPALTEIWVSTLLGLVDAERRGRIARAGMAALLERAFLHGAAAAPA